MKVIEIILEIKFTKYLVIFRHRKRLHIGKFERKHEIFLLKWIKHIRLKKHFLTIWYIQSTGQGGLACCSPWGRKESDMTEQVNWTELASPVVIIMINKVQSFNLTEGKSILTDNTEQNEQSLYCRGAEIWKTESGCGVRIYRNQVEFKLNLKIFNNYRLR